ncbi:hypothetical protein M3J07_004822 [Ascochyta lentis]
MVLVRRIGHAVFLGISVILYLYPDKSEARVACAVPAGRRLVSPECQQVIWAIAAAMKMSRRGQE